MCQHGIGEVAGESAVKSRLRHCDHCGIEFRTSAPAQRYCTPIHAAEAARAKRPRRPRSQGEETPVPSEPTGQVGGHCAFCGDVVLVVCGACRDEHGLSSDIIPVIPTSLLTHGVRSSWWVAKTAAHQETTDEA